MPEIEYRIIPLTPKNINLLEKIRFNAYGIDTTIFSPQNSFYTKELNKDKYLVFGCYLNNQLIGACYTKATYNSFYIEQLFIQKQYQKSNLNLGTNLLKYALANKAKAEKYFQTTFTYSYLDNSSNTTHFYQNIGYKKANTLMKKKL